MMPDPTIVQRDVERTLEDHVSAINEALRERKELPWESLMLVMGDPSKSVTMPMCSQDHEHGHCCFPDW
jgi:hypothetical protein